jgi:hypothetical protein
MKTISATALDIGGRTPSHLMDLAIELDRLESIDINALSDEEHLQLHLLRQAYRHEIELLEARATGRLAV